MMTRRRFIGTAAAFVGGLWLRPAIVSGANKPEWLMPDEAAPHQRTWMAFGASQKIWGKKLLPRVQRDLVTIAHAIAQFEPVSMLVRKGNLDQARKLFGSAVELVECPLDDLWLRDTGPIFVTNQQGQKAAVDFNFNGWGKKQAHDRDAKVAGFVAKRAGVDTIRAKLVLEGGGIEVDGAGTALIAESCVLNSNRNPGVTKAECEAVLKELLGLQKIIWLPGIKGKDITDGHTDFYARFTQPGVVVAHFDSDLKSYDHRVTQTNLAILNAATDAQGRRLQVVAIHGPATLRKGNIDKDFAAGYINFYVCNGAVIAPQFGDARADDVAREKLQDLFPSRKIVPLNIDGIAAGGGGIHCTTQQEPATKSS